MARPTRSRGAASARPRTSRATRERREPDDLDREIDRSEATGQPIRPARAHRNQPAEPPSGPAGVLTPSEGPAPADRPVADPAAVIASLTAAGGEGYVKEYELRTLHRLLMRNTRIEIIARAMDKSVTEVIRLRRILFRRLRMEASNVDMLTHAGQTMAFFNEIAGMAMRIATDDNVQPISRLAAMREARGAITDKVTFLKTAGFYSTTKYTPKIDETDPAARQAENTARMLRAIIDPTMDEQAKNDLLDQIAAEASEDLSSVDYDNDTQIL